MAQFGSEIKSSVPDLFLVTGATGFIGSDLCASLVKKHGAKNVYLLQRRVPDFTESILAQRFKEYGLDLAQDTPNFIIADFENFDDLKEKLSFLSTISQKWVFAHLAAVIDRKNLNRREQFRINVTLSRLLVEWANENAGRFIYTSSISAFGLSTNKKVRDEDSYWKFHWVSNLVPYYLTKRKAHDAVLADLKIPYSVFCPSVVHGSLEFAKESRAHIKKVIAKDFKLFPPGGANFVTLDMVTKSLLLATEDHSSNSQVQLLVGENLLLIDYVNIWKKVAGAKESRPILLPRFIFWFVLLIYLPIVYFKRIKAFESVLTTFYFFYFQSKYPLPQTTSLEEAIRKACNSTKTS